MLIYHLVANEKTWIIVRREKQRKFRQASAVHFNYKRCNQAEANVASVTESMRRHWNLWNQGDFEKNVTRCGLNKNFTWKIFQFQSVF